MPLELAQKIPAAFSSQWMSFPVLGFTLMESEVGLEVLGTAARPVPGKQ